MRELLPAHPGYDGEMVWIVIILERWLERHPEAPLRVRAPCGADVVSP
jgi:hypothetical protein